MFTLAILIGIYSYIIFFLGIFGWLYRPVVNGVTILFAIVCILCFFSNVKRKALSVKLEKWSFPVIFLLCLQIFINLIGALSPETAFDALWYHLTFPKMYLLNHKIFHMSGIFYYSDMPKLIEMLYTGALALQSEILAKLFHFSFGILSLLVLYKLSRKFFNQMVSLICLLIFYSSLVVGWESITAYVDLGRTFFEIMALWTWVEWYETRKGKWIVMLGIMTGIVITTKVLAMGTCIIFLFLFMIIYFKDIVKIKYQKYFFFTINFLFLLFPFLFISLFIPLPWFIFSYIHTGNPVYPFFTNYPVGHSVSLLNPVKFFHDIWILFTRADDPVSPVFMGFLPLIIISFSKMSKTFKFIGYYAILAILVWHITPRSGGGRFILPYLPAFSLLSAWCVSYYEKTIVQKILIGFVLLVAVVSIGYRGIANAKYLPVIFGKESKAQFLSDHLNFSFGDFYDTDGYFAKHIKPTDCVGLIGFFNLYYVDFPTNDLYDPVSKKCRINYIATQHTKLPKQYVGWKNIYENKKTGVALYTHRVCVSHTRCETRY